MFEVVTVKEALHRIINSVIDMDNEMEEVNILQALNRITGEKIVSSEVVPHFSRSTMDGFAVRAEDTFGASESMPAFLDIKGEINMGEEPGEDLKAGETMKIATGGMLPPGADSVLMLEHAEELDEKMLACHQPVAPGENVILEGEDLKEGEGVLEKNHRIRSQDIGALAAAGITRVKVLAPPRVAVISTGDELVSPGEKPKPGQIRDVNSFALAAAIQSAGAFPILCGIVRDEKSLLREAVEGVREEASLILISGGSSVGTRDVTAKVIDELGDPGVLVHGISIRPGKPTIYGMARKTPIFGLSGNPVSALVTFDIFVAPLIYRLRGLEREEIIPSRVKARVSRNIPSSQGREDYVRVKLEKEESGEYKAVPVFGKSGLITTLVDARGVICISQNKEGLEEGEEVEVILY